MAAPVLLHRLQLGSVLSFVLAPVLMAVVVSDLNIDCR